MKILTTLAVALVSSTAMAQSEGPSKDQDPAGNSTQATFEALDRNNDQRLSKAEAKADDGLSAQFAALDTNSDGYINKREYSTHTRQPTTPDSTVPAPGRR